MISCAQTYARHVVGANSKALKVERITKWPQVRHPMATTTGLKPNLKTT
jgi:hypothetical protein